MQILLSPAKDMTDSVKVVPALATSPMFQQEANENVLELLNYSVEELQSFLKCNAKLAALNQLRYKSFFDEEPKLQAVLSYTGMAYRHLDAAGFTPEEFAYANRHLWITSFLYGLLRPMDRIKNYRLEGTVRLPNHDFKTMFEFWRPLLTDVLIRSVKEDDGILVHCATEEITHLFDWKRVKQEVQVLEPQFCVNTGSKLKTVTVYAKMCRGAMARYIIQNKCRTREELTTFTHEGYRYNPSYPAESPDILWFLLEE